MATPESSLDKLIAQLPEIYQPIVGHPKYDERASRAQDSRLKEVLGVYTALTQLKGRPLNVLDLGCAQGYFSLSLAERGAKVHGVDYLEANIAVCKQLAEENPGWSVTFEVDRIEAVIERMAFGQYDLVLGLSVFHHLIYLHGVDYVQMLLQRVAANDASLLAEIALASEPLYWASVQPSEPRSLFARIAFVRCLGWYPTHLSDVNRPLFFASDAHWYFGSDAISFEGWRKTSHDRALDVHRGSRAYYFADRVIAKKFLIEGEVGEANRIELERESAVLRKDLPGFPLPRLLAVGHANGEMWLLREMIGGRLLSDVLNGLDLQMRRRILIQILEQLAALERLGLYHSDVRAWNVIVDDQSVPQLIDYGAIGAEATDCVWPHDIHLATLIFAQEVVTGEVAVSDPLRRAALSPESLAPELRAWAHLMFRKPLAEWSFSEMASTLALQWAAPIEEGVGLSDQRLWLTLMEQALQAQLHHAKHLRALIDITTQESIKRVELERATAWSDKEQIRLDAEKRMDALESRQAIQTDDHQALVDRFQKNVEETLAVHRKFHEELITVRTQLDQARQRLDSFDGEIALIRNSRSWQLTAPLRSANRRLASANLKAKVWLRPRLVRVARRMIAIPVLRRAVHRMLALIPRLDARTQRFLRNARLIGTVDHHESASRPKVERAISRRADVISATMGLRDPGKRDS
jgi:O-antigen chain-terminating bifunctional methyltransferase/kinase